ncbi:MAG: hypoxanthine phosphoribosyltransferase [Solirubrobacterales bacterium]
MIDDVEVLFTETEIRAKVQELGRRITADYQGEELLVVGILKGAFVFMADLVRCIGLPVTMDFMDLSSYGASDHSSGEVRILKDLEQPIEGRHVLIVEDIIDTGVTLKYILEILQRRQPKSLKICTFLDKPSRRKSDVVSDYNGFSIPDHFVVGYGLDYAEKYRNLAGVYKLKPEAIQRGVGS